MYAGIQTQSACSVSKQPKFASPGSNHRPAGSAESASQPVNHLSRQTKPATSKGCLGFPPSWPKREAGQPIPEPTPVPVIIPGTTSSRRLRDNTVQRGHTCMHTFYVGCITWWVRSKQALAHGNHWALVARAHTYTPCPSTGHLPPHTTPSTPTADGTRWPRRITTVRPRQRVCSPQGFKQV